MKTFEGSESCGFRVARDTLKRSARAAASPYRKPQQEPKARSLWHTGEGRLGNSAKWTRNFGRRVASVIF